MRQRFNTAKAETESPTVCLGSCIMNTDQCQVPHCGYWFSFNNSSINSCKHQNLLLTLTIDELHIESRRNLQAKKSCEPIFNTHGIFVYYPLVSGRGSPTIRFSIFWERDCVYERKRYIERDRVCEKKKEREAQRAKWVLTYEKGKKEYGAI